MELDKPLHVLDFLVFCDHFTRQIMAYVTPDQTAKTVAKFLWQGYILIFGAPAKLLSDQGANFDSNIISEVYELMGIWKARISLYHPQTNQQVEQAHQTLMQMIGKLGKGWKAEWPKHLPELLYAYNSTRLAITGYNPHYLMFGWWMCLPITFYFPPLWAQKNSGMSTTMLLNYVSDCAKPSRNCKCCPHLRLKGKGDTMIIKLMPFHWNQVTWFLLKPMPTKGGERWMTGGRKNSMKWNTELLKVSLPTLWKTRGPDTNESSRINFFSLPP